MDITEKLLRKIDGLTEISDLARAKAKVLLQKLPILPDEIVPLVDDGGISLGWYGDDSLTDASKGHGVFDIFIYNGGKADALILPDEIWEIDLDSKNSILETIGHLRRFLDK